MNCQGFSIIELIVVIAIISILSSVVIINISNTILKAKDASIKTEVHSLSAVGVKYFEEHGNYGGFCNYDETEKIFDAIPSPKKYKYCHHDNDKWAVCAQLNLPADQSKAWCTDNTGNVKQIDQVDCVSSITFCP